MVHAQRGSQVAQSSVDAVILASDRVQAAEAHAARKVAKPVFDPSPLLSSTVVATGDTTQCASFPDERRRARDAQRQRRRDGRPRPRFRRCGSDYVTHCDTSIMALPLPGRKLPAVVACDAIVFFVIVPAQALAFRLLHAFPQSLFALFSILLVEAACLTFIVFALLIQAALVRDGVTFTLSRLRALLHKHR